MNKKLLAATAMGVALLSGSAYAEDGANDNENVNARIAKLEEEIQLLKRQQEVKQEVDDTKAQKTANTEFDKHGITISSPDKNFVAKLNGYTQVDTRTFLSDTDRNGKDDILLRTLRPQIDLTLYKDLSFRYSPDFGSAGYKLYDAWAQYKYSDPLQLRIGKFKPPLGLERLESPTDTFFAELGQTSNLVPNRDLGVQLFGNIIPEVEYAVGVFDGGADLGNNDSDDDDSKDIAARIFLSPFKRSDELALQGLGFGVGASHGNRSGSTATSILPAYKTPGQSTFFSYKTGVFASGDNWRFVPQAYYYYDNFGALAEYAVSSQDVKFGTFSDTIKNEAWNISLAYVLTGENENYKGSVTPAENFDPKNGTWGAFELVGRVGETNIDDAAFSTTAAKSVASSATSASSAFDLGVGVNWYWNDNIRFMVDYDNTSFDGGKVGGDRETENVILTRLQLKFQ